MKPEIYYFDAKFSKWWRNKEEAAMNSIEPVAVVNLSAHQEAQEEIERLRSVINKAIAHYDELKVTAGWHDLQIKEFRKALNQKEDEK
jgi:hypothetical protein